MNPKGLRVYKISFLSIHSLPNVHHQVKAISIFNLSVNAATIMRNAESPGHTYKRMIIVY